MNSTAWRLSAPGGKLSIEQVEEPIPRPGTVLVNMEAVPILSYLGAYAAGELPYQYPTGPFTVGTNGVGTIEAVGADVYHFTVGQRVAINPFLSANEVTDEPAEVLIGLTGISADSGQMLASWGDGTLSKRVLMPASALAPLDGLELLTSERLATLGKFVVPLGGLLRGRLAQGETLIVNGASGYFGSGAVMLGLALGAERVVAIARSKDVLENLVAVGGRRVVPIVLSGDVEADIKALKEAAGGHGAHLAFDQVGNANDPNSTLATLRSLRRGGRLVLMGSMTVPLPLNYNEMIINDWEVIGNFMYRPEAFKTLISLVRSRLLDLHAVRVNRFGFEELPEAMKQAAKMRGLDCVVVVVAGEKENATLKLQSTQSRFLRSS